MADSAARAEARKKKILQFSQNRLAKITGRAEEPTATDGVIDDEYPFSQPENATFREDSTLSAEEQRILLDNLQNNFFGNNQTHQDEDIEELSKLSLFFTTKMHIVLLSILIQVLYIFNNKLFSDGYLFLPLIVLEATEWFFLTPVRQQSIISTFLAMSGISPRKIQFFLHVTQGAMKFFQDSCIYLFVTVIIQAARLAVL